jgi:hypothetical protein
MWAGSRSNGGDVDPAAAARGDGRTPTPRQPLIVVGARALVRSSRRTAALSRRRACRTRRWRRPRPRIRQSSLDEPTPQATQSPPAHCLPPPRPLRRLLFPSSPANPPATPEVPRLPGPWRPPPSPLRRVPQAGIPKPSEALPWCLRERCALVGGRRDEDPVRGTRVQRPGRGLRPSWTTRSNMLRESTVRGRDSPVDHQVVDRAADVVDTVGDGTVDDGGPGRRRASPVTARPRLSAAAPFPTGHPTRAHACTPPPRRPERGLRKASGRRPRAPMHRAGIGVRSQHETQRSR